MKTSSPKPQSPAIGAKFEGVFRNHMIMPDGSIRHSHWYSIIREEWPEVKSNLETRLNRFRLPLNCHPDRTPSVVEEALVGCAVTTF